MIHLKSQFLALELEDHLASFRLLSSSAGASLRSASPWLVYRRQGRQYFIKISDLVLEELQSSLFLPTSSSTLSAARWRFRSPDTGLEIQLELGLLQEHPLFLMRMQILNQGDASVEIERLGLIDIAPQSLSLTQDNCGSYSFYVNGWQSWSPTGCYMATDRQQRTRLGTLTQPMIHNPGTPLTYQAGHFSSDMFGILSNLNAKTGLLAGFLSQREHFGSLEADLRADPSLKIWANGDRAHLAPGANMHSDWLSIGFISLDSPMPLQTYLAAVQRETAVSNLPQPPVGWCSWYYYFRNINPQILETNLKEIQRLRQALPLQLMQIDDGFQADVGTWLQFNKHFPNGVQSLAKQIKEAGLQAGIWLAPYILQADSSLIKKHPNWLLRRRDGRLANTGFGWGNRLCRALDLTHPEALSYTREVIRTAVEDWGFTYLKLDFLYAAAVDCAYQDPTKTRAQVLLAGLQSIRQAAGTNTTLLGCGCPIGPALGLLDLMRISADVAPDWYPRFPPFSPILRSEPNMPSVRNALQNILSRSDLDQHWFGNDPDCLMVRPDSRLTLAEVQTLATAIGITGGAMLLSDNLEKLPPQRLRIAQQFIPIIPGNPRVLDRLQSTRPAKVRHDLIDAQGPFTILAFFNWSDLAQDLFFDPQEWGFDGHQNWIGREFWTGEFLDLSETLLFSQVPAHGCRLFTLRPLKGPAQYLGSSLHFSQGFELKTWQQKPRSIRFTVDLNHEMSGEVFLRLEQAPRQVLVSGQPSQLQYLQKKIYALPLEVKNSAEVHLYFDLSTKTSNKQ
jgi:alpha-galactosidase